MPTADLRLGPDAARYWFAGGGGRVARPFHLRWLLPLVCGQHIRRWWAVWWSSWPVLFVGVWWLAADLGWQRATFAAVLCVALPGVWGPHVVRPVGVDLPAMALTAVAAAAAVHGWWWLAILALAFAAEIKETAPVWAALWAWDPALLLALIFPLAALVAIRPELDPITAGHPVLRRVHDHPIRTAFEHRRGRLRDAHLWVTPWGASLAGLYGLTPQVAATLAVAHAQAVVATDTVRPVQTAAGPVLAIAAAQVLPLQWLPLAALLSVFWWRQVETQ